VTPLALGNHPGPLQPGSHREVIRYIRRVVGEPAVKVEVSDVRIWNGPTDKATKQPATGSTAQPT
jgi:hypothetical protein